MNNLAFFNIHNIFLTKEEINNLIKGKSIDVIGHSVPVWVNAKTGQTTEPANELFCNYKIHNSSESQREIKLIPKKGYEIFIPNKSSWDPPQENDYEKMALWPSEERIKFCKKMDNWWFSNPKPPDVSNLKNGYLRFEIKNSNLKIQSKKYSEQHIVEISIIERLIKSLAT